MPWPEAHGHTQGIQNNIIQDNHAYDPTAFGGTGGGLYWSVIPGVAGTVSILHNTLVGNIATNSFSEQGGGLAFVLTENSNRLVIANNLFASNSSGLYQAPSSPLARPILERNNLVNLRSNYINLPAGPTDLSVAPGFVGNSDWRLRTDSACVDAGTSGYTTGFDLLGIARPLDGNNDGLAGPDLGALETVYSTGTWKSTTPIDSLKIYPGDAAASFVAGTSISVFTIA